MDEKNKLDAYLENLGISDEDESATPTLPPSQTAPSMSSGLSPVSSRPAEMVQSSGQTSGQTSGPSDEGRMNRLVASSDAIIEDFLSGMLVYIDPGYTVSARTRNDTINAEILGGDPGKVIGREGRTLAAIEFLANTVIAKEQGHGGPRVSVDAAGYRRRHEERLLDQARRHAAKVRKSGEDMELEPMNAADRRIIHIALKEDAFVMTESVGEGRDRRLVIKAR
jgi:spoIIIJ-associated protein